MVKNTKEVNSKKAVEGTLCKLFGFKKVMWEDGSYWLELVIKCKDFNVIINIEDLYLLEVYIGTKNKQEELLVLEGKYNFNRLKQLVNRYKALK